jgi:hypothetical protein
MNIEQEFEDTKGVIRIHKSKDRHHNGQKIKQDIRTQFRPTFVQYIYIVVK